MGRENIQDSLVGPEAKFILEINSAGRRSNDPQWQPNKVFQDSLDFLQRFSHGLGQAQAAQIRQKLERHVEGIEAATIANLMPHNAEEAKTLVHSLQDGSVSDDELEEILNELRVIQAAGS